MKKERSVPYCVSLPSMDVFLTENFFTGQLGRPRRLHSHPAYELVCIDGEDGMRFIVHPPLQEHLAVDAPREKTSSLLFSFSPGKTEDVCHQLKYLTQPTELSDPGGGRSRILTAKTLAEELHLPGAADQLAAELWLLFICLGRSLSPEDVRKAPLSNLDRKRLALLEAHFNIDLKDPECSKKNLAAQLGVSERHLGRILREVYGDSYSNLLLRSRMSIAEAMRREGVRSAETLAHAVGYRSPVAFRRARRRFLAELNKK